MLMLAYGKLSNMWVYLEIQPSVPLDFHHLLSFQLLIYQGRWNANNFSDSLYRIYNVKRQ